MRILLRNRLRGFYLLSGGDGGVWTDNRDAALAFPSSLEALKFVQQHGLDDMEVVLTFGAPDMDLSITAQRILPKRKKPQAPEHPTL